MIDRIEMDKAAVLSYEELDEVVGGGKRLSDWTNYPKGSSEEAVWISLNTINTSRGKRVPTTGKCAGTDGGTKDFETIGDDCHDRY